MRPLRETVPWTSDRIEAAKILADEIQELNPEERLLLKASIDQIAVRHRNDRGGCHKNQEAPAENWKGYVGVLPETDHRHRQRDGKKVARPVRLVLSWTGVAPIAGAIGVAVAVGAWLCGRAPTVRSIADIGGAGAWAK